MLWWASITEAEDEVDMVVLCIVLNDGVPKGPKGGQLQGKATCSGRSTVRPTWQRAFEMFRKLQACTISPASYTVSKETGARGETS